MNATVQDVAYAVDFDDVLVEANSQWDAFAAANGSAHLVRDKVINRSLWDFIHDPETRQVHRMLAAKVRTKGVSLRLPFRCDSPSQRRFMQMEIAPARRGGVRYRCKVLLTEDRKPAQPRAAGPERMLRVCSWCKRVYVAPGRWMELEDAIRDMRLFELGMIPPMTHTMCEDCIRRLEKEAG